MSILTDIPQRQRFEDFSERGAFHAWMRHAIIFAVIASVAALLIVYLMDSKREKNEKLPVKDKATEQLPVVADLPMKKSTSATAVKPPAKPSAALTNPQKSGTSTSKRTTTSTAPHKTTKTH